MPTTPLATIETGLEALSQGKMVILVDDEDRENEGDLVLAAEKVTPEAINFMATHARGLICLALNSERVDQLELPLMSQRSLSKKRTAFTVSIEARDGVTTGISAADRSKTVQVAMDPSKSSLDLVSPGHIFPLRAQGGGVLVRAGHTEGSVDLARLAGFLPGAVICEIMNEDGSMARRGDLFNFAKKHGDIPILTIRDLISFRMQKESLIKKAAESTLPTQWGEFRVMAFESVIDNTEHLALVRGNLDGEPLVRVHSECLTGDAFQSLRCDCGPQLHQALQRISESNNGVLVYMRNQEGRGIGLANKVRAYHLQDHGLDTVEANEKLGFKPDLRHYGIGAQILRSLGIQRMRLLTNNPKKIIGLDGYGLTVTDQLAIEVKPNPHNLNYLLAKRDKLNHSLNLEPKES